MKKAILTFLLLFCFLLYQAAFCFASYSPGIVAVIPPDNSQDFDVNDEMTVMFNMNMDLSTVTKANVTVNGRRDLVRYVRTDEENPRIAVIGFAGLSYFTEYTVEFSGMKNRLGDSIAPVQTTFTTKKYEQVYLENLFDSSPDFTWPNVSPSNILLTQITDDDLSCAHALVQAADGEIYFNDRNGYPVKLEIGADYTISFSVMADGTTQMQEVNLVRGDNLAFLLRCQLTEEMKNYSITFTATSENPADIASGTVPLPWLRAGGGTTSFYIDNYVVKKVHSEPLEQLKIMQSIPQKNSKFNPLAEIKIFYNHAVIEDTALNADNYELIGSSNFVKSVKKQSDKVYILEFDEVLTPLTEYTLNISNIKDEYNQTIDNCCIFFETLDYDEIQVDSIRLYKHYGTDMQFEIDNDFFDYGELTIVLENFENFSNRQINATVLSALYKNNVLTYLSSQLISIGEFQRKEEQMVIPLTVPEIEDISQYSLKVLIWDFQNMKPLEDYIVWREYK